MRAVADAGPLIRLSWIDRLDLLGALFDQVLVPVAVWNEVTPPGVISPASRRSLPPTAGNGCRYDPCVTRRTLTLSAMSWIAAKPKRLSCYKRLRQTRYSWMIGRPEARPCGAAFLTLARSVCCG